MVDRIVPMLLLRHGQSEWNAIRRWQGLADSHLTELGREQAASSAGALESTGHRFAAVWTSPLRRAAETGEIIARRLGIGSMATDERLREADAGEWEGLTPDEIEIAYPGYLAAHRRPATFEPIGAVVTRSVTALRTIARQHVAGADQGVVIVTTHSGVIRSLIRTLGHADERIPNLGGVWLTVASGGSAAESVTDVTDDSPVGFDVGDRFDPAGLVRTGVDVPGEDPGEQPDQTDAHGRTER
jgi:probable phosphoglycerate mutase